MSKTHPYNGVTAALGTMHGKERAIGPPLYKELHISLHVPSYIDTDAFGTFSGEVERTKTAVEAARAKAKLSMELLGLPYGIASEGSFGPYRHFPLAAEDCEILLWIDEERHVEIQERIITTDTNYSSIVVSSCEELGSYLKQVRFPSHALVVRPNRSEQILVYKGITSMKMLQEAVVRCKEVSMDDLVLVQTDMRAHQNPTRMKVIREAASRLAARLASLCPACACPGWGKIGMLQGLPCEQCKCPTSQVQKEIYGCVKCGTERQLARSDGKTEANAMYCPICNP